MKKIFALLLAVLLAMICAGAFAVEEHRHVTCFCSKGCSRTDTGHSNGMVFLPIDSIEGNVLQEGSYYLVKDINVTSEIHINGEVYLCGNGFKIAMSNGEDPFTVSEGGHLYLHNCENAENLPWHTCSICSCGAADCDSTEPGHSRIVNATALVTIDDTNLTKGHYYLVEDLEVSNTLHITDEVHLCLNGHTLTMKSNSDAVSVQGAVNQSGQFCLYDCNGSGADKGKITHTPGKTGSGVHIGNRGSMIMYDGRISGNTAQNGGGVSLDGAHSSLTMYGGEISGNTAQNGGGVYEKVGTVAVVNGKINGNTAQNGGGVYAEHNVYIGISGNPMDNGVVTGAAQISNNTATGNGGGVYAVAATVNGAAQITGNQAENGGGMYTDTGTSVVRDAVQITDNMANGNGGGLYVFNQASLEGDALQIRGNKANGNGGGVYAAADAQDVPVIVGMRAQVDGNTDGSGNASNVYLSSGKKMWLGADDGAKIGVTTEQKPTPDEPVIYAERAIYDESRTFSDDPAYETVTDDNTAMLYARYTAPKAKDGLVYDGSAQELVTPGEMDKGVAGRLEYTLGEDAQNAPTDGWSVDIPTGKDAGTYCVWYRVVIENDPIAPVPKCLPVSIAKVAADTSDLPETGDNSRIALWIGLLGMAGAAMMMLKKREQN